MGWFDDIKAMGKQSMARFNNATFKEAAMATCALIAAADGEVEQEEVKKTAEIIGKCEQLAVFDPMDLKKTFEGFCTKAVDDFARNDLLNKVRRLNGMTEQAHLVVGIAVLIAKSDGEFEEKEKLVVGELCGVLGIPATQFVS